MGILEHRSAAYFQYVSTGAQQIAFRSPAWAGSRSVLEDGGAEGDRTPDLCNAIAALSQLSYGPIRWQGVAH